MNQALHPATRELLALHQNTDQASIEALEDELVHALHLPLTDDADLDLEALDLALHARAEHLALARERIQHYRGAIAPERSPA